MMDDNLVIIKGYYEDDSFIEVINIDELEEGDNYIEVRNDSLPVRVLRKERNYSVLIKEFPSGETHKAIKFL